MQAFLFVFLHRRWENDEPVINNMIDYFKQREEQTNLLIFPEGTDMCKFAKPRAQLYARKNDLSVYDYCMHPKVKGVTHMYERMKDSLDAIYDCTIAYEMKNARDQIIDVPGFLTGNFPKFIHVHLNRIPVEDLPESGFEDVVKNSFAEKECRLEKFYSHSKSFGDEVFSPSERPSFALSFVSFIMWFSHLILVGVALFLIPYFWVYLAVNAVILQICYSFFGGIDNIELYFCSTPELSKEE
eukprot:TRINITY_DN1240_c0_g1_i2.p1 TRINITY_DN1240_c0_g1~~TRINITY_DN1240_c0_g1_i2.p1  ORF type:complete len:242 (-),score=39.70 TRINITY_DN1240_c0_g1_i2:247-972(-)